MNRRLLLALSFATAVIAGSACIGSSFAAQLSHAAFALPSLGTGALTKIQSACGWTYSCTNLGSGTNAPQQVQIYGPVNIYTGADVKPEIWKVPEGAWPWAAQDNQDGQTWRGWGCGGYPCDERCGAFCWFNRVRNGYCGHGCDVYREHVMFQPISGNLRPFVYRDPPDCDYGYGGQGGYVPRDGYGYGPATRNRPCWNGYPAGRFNQTSSQQGGYYPPSNGGGRAPPPGYPQGADQGPSGGPAENPGGERFIDRLRRFFTGRQPYPQTAANGPVRFERPSNDLVPLKRFNGPKYPPTCSSGKNC